MFYYKSGHLYPPTQQHFDSSTLGAVPYPIGHGAPPPKYRAITIWLIVFVCVFVLDLLVSGWLGIYHKLFLFSSKIPEKFIIRFNDVGDSIDSEGLPFIILSKYEKNCVLGKDKRKLDKRKKEKKRDEELKVYKHKNSLFFMNIE